MRNMSDIFMDEADYFECSTAPNDEVERSGVRRPKTKLIYPNHRLPPWLNEDAARDRSNRLLDVAPGFRLSLGIIAALQLPSC